MNEWTDKIRAMDEPTAANWLHDIDEEISSHEKLINQWKNDLKEIDNMYPHIVDSRVEETIDVFNCNIDRSEKRIEVLRARQEIVKAICDDKVRINSQT